MAGFTMMMVSTQRDQVRERRAHKDRSTVRNHGRATVRRKTASCCFRARFSSTKLARGRTSAQRAPKMAATAAGTSPVPRSEWTMSPQNRGANFSEISRRPAGLSAAGQVFVTTGRSSLGAGYRSPVRQMHWPLVRIRQPALAIVPVRAIPPSIYSHDDHDDHECQNVP